MGSIIRFKNLSFLNHIKYPDTNIEKNEFVFISGPSGAGKSSLFKIINATACKTSGELFVFEKKIEDYDTLELRKKVVLAGQSVFLFSGSIEQNFNEFYDFREEERITANKKIKYLSLCGIDFPITKDVSSMSGGERQRIFVAVCLSFMPEILLLDEPTSGLDYENSEKFIKNIKSFCKENNITLFIISHDCDMISRYADKIIEIGGQ